MLAPAFEWVSVGQAQRIHDDGGRGVRSCHLVDGKACSGLNILDLELLLFYEG